VRSARQRVGAALLLCASACTIGPAGGDGGTGGTGGTTTTPPRPLGDQCESVLSVFCQKEASCAIPVDLGQCISGDMSLCCVGSACNATSTVSEASVTACEEMIMAEDCYPVSITTDPTACLTSP
jgi:hypothetical protein